MKTASAERPDVQNTVVDSGSPNEILIEIRDRAKKEDVYIIGGASIYRQMLPYCEKVLLTKVHRDGGAEVFFTNLDELENFVVESSSEPMMDGEIEIQFLTYRNLAPKKIRRKRKTKSDLKA